MICLPLSSILVHGNTHVCTHTHTHTHTHASCMIAAASFLCCFLFSHHLTPMRCHCSSTYLRRPEKFLWSKAVEIATDGFVSQPRLCFPPGSGWWHLSCHLRRWACLPKTKKPVTLVVCGASAAGFIQPLTTISIFWVPAMCQATALGTGGWLHD